MLWPWVRGEWRRGWTSLLGIALLVGLGGGITLAAAAGARRADSAVERRIESEGWTVTATISSLVTLDEMGGVVDDELLQRVAAIPGVRGVAALTWVGAGLEIDGEPASLFSGGLGDVIGVSPTESVVAGRAADPHSAHEVVINEAAAARASVGVGDTVTLRSYASDQVEEFYAGNGAADLGPRVEVEVVGIVRTLEDISSQPEDRVTLTPRFMDHYGADMVSCTCGIAVNVPLDAVAAVAAEVDGIVSKTSMVVGTIADEQSEILGQAVSIEVGSLLVAALVAAVASIAVILQALARQAANRQTDARALTAIGATRTNRVGAWMFVIAPSLVAGTVCAVVIAASLSPLFPRGIARQAEVDPGWRFDTTVLLGGAIALLAIVTLGSSWFAWRSARYTGETTSTARHGALGGISFRPTAALGASLALDPSSDGRRVAAAGAVVAAAFAIAGIAGVAVIEQSVDDTLASPEAVGQPWDLELQEAPADAESVITATAAEPIDAMALDFRLGGTDFKVAGDGGQWLVQPMMFENLVGTMTPFITDGNGAIDDDDVVLGPQVAQRLGADVGSEVRFTPGPVTFTVVGIGRLSDGDRADEFAYVTSDGLERLGQGQQPDINGAMVRLGPDPDEGTSERLLALGWKPKLLPAKVSTLDQIGTVPRLLAVGLGILGMGAVLHTLLVAVSRRRGDIAVVRAIGFVPRQARSSIGWQALFTVAVGALVGVPVGVLLGRVIWKQVVSGVGALDLVSVPWLALVAIAGAALGLCTLCGLAVGRRAAHLHPAAVLRNE